MTSTSDDRTPLTADPSSTSRISEAVDGSYRIPTPANISTWYRNCDRNLRRGGRPQLRALYAIGYNDGLLRAAAIYPPLHPAFGSYPARVAVLARYVFSSPAVCVAVIELWLAWGDGNPLEMPAVLEQYLAATPSVRRFTRNLVVQSAGTPPSAADIAAAVAGVFQAEDA
jgi:hypothetical protein